LKNIAIIPARQGSKGIADKNIKPLFGKPLLLYSLEAAKSAGVFDEIFVSTDSQQYAELAQKAGASVPFLRSPALATDFSSTWDAAREAIYRYREMGKEFDTVTILQPTSPLRTPEDILNGCNLMQEKNADMVVGVCEADYPPVWSNQLLQDHCLKNFIDAQYAGKPRQNLPTYYRINGALYIIKTDYLMHHDNNYNEGSFAVVMSKENSIDIDDLLDFMLAETILNYRKNGLISR
jgi:CMP-N,N'-diacetyllegionaminic acid synthase